MTGPPLDEATIERNLARLGLTLPEAPSPVASYVPARRTGDLVHISGQIPIVDGALIATGRVPDAVDDETALRCARVCTLNALACLRAEIGDLGAIRRVVHVGVFVAASPGYTEHPKIANGCSDLLVELLGQRGVHARAAVGVASLPLGAPVEIEFIFEVG